MQYEGFRPGMYLRIEIENMPCEFVVNFDPHYPMILGGLGNSEGNVGYIQVKQVRVLGTPFVFSVCVCLSNELSLIYVNTYTDKYHPKVFAYSVLLLSLRPIKGTQRNKCKFTFTIASCVCFS